jgi:hypothetical protein
MGPLIIAAVTSLRAKFKECYRSCATATGDEKKWGDTPQAPRPAAPFSGETDSAMKKGFFAICRFAYFQMNYRSEGLPGMGLLSDEMLPKIWYSAMELTNGGCLRKDNRKL